MSKTVESFVESPKYNLLVSVGRVFRFDMMQNADRGVTEKDCKCHRKFVIPT